MQSIFRLGALFFIELLFLVWDFCKCFFWTIFYLLCSPTEKYVRNEVVLITGSATGLGKQLLELRAHTALSKFNLIIV
jgi:hypothetical protein